MPYAYWSGAYYTIPSGMGNGITQRHKDWIHDRVDQGYDRKQWAWQIPIDMTDEDELAENGFFVVDQADHTPVRLPPMPPAPVYDPNRELFLPMDLMWYQLDGLKMLLAGRRILGDAPGVGKTRQLMSTIYNLDAARAIVIVPKIAITTPWTKQLQEICDIVKESDPGLSPTKTEGNLVVVQGKAQMKRLDGFSNGVLLTTDSALSASEDFIKWVIEWGPELMIYDEAHNAKTFDSRRARHLRAIASRTPTVITATGTPYLKDTAEIMTPLVMTGAIELFGGIDNFVKEFTWENQWHQRVGLKRKTKQIRQVLDDFVWVRRTKEEVLSDLPPKIRRFVPIDIPLDTVHEVHDSIIEKIDAWLDECKDTPTAEEIRAWASDNIRYITQMRVAAGVSKSDEVIERIDRWVSKYGSERPLVVWGCYQDTISAIYNKSLERGHRIGRLDGTISRSQRDKTVTAFQEGELDLIVASIYAAGTAITLTRSHDAVFAEIDWTPDLIVQAEDRCHRFGQEHTVHVTTLVAKGTLDEHIQRVLERKIKFLEEAAGGDHEVAFVQKNSSFSIVSLLTELVYARIN
jgi:hypothetical protein